MNDEIMSYLAKDLSLKTGQSVPRMIELLTLGVTPEAIIEGSKLASDKLGETTKEPLKVSDIVPERMEEKELEKIAPSTGYGKLDELIKGFIPGHGYLLSAFTNVGKCEAKDTQHLMYDGSIKPVQDIVVGDLLMGPDNKPRKVLSTTSGTDEMFTIKQDWGNPYTVNKDHILSLKCSNVSLKGYQPGEITNISVLDYMKKSSTFKKFFRGWSVGVDYPEQNVFDPYLIGVWLGDGTSSKPQITSTDKEIIDYIYQFSSKNNLSVRVEDKITYSISSGKQISYIEVDEKEYNQQEAADLFGKSIATIHNWMKWGWINYRKRKNIFWDELKKYNLVKNKHIPEPYRINSRRVRLEILAGIIDTDGWVQKNVSKNGKECFSYAVSITNKRLSEDILLLTRSLGFNSRVRTKIAKMKREDGSIYQTQCFTVSIQGDLSVIPVKIPRKKITSTRKKSVGLSSFKIIPQGVGEYFGFTLDGDGLYLLSDCTVTHNTALCCNFSYAVASQGKRVLYIALEPDNSVIDYFASIATGKRYDDITKDDYDKVPETIDIYLKNKIRTQVDLVKVIRERDRYDLIVIDHFGYFNQSQQNKFNEESNNVKELISVAKEKKCAIIIIQHFNKAGGDKKKNKLPSMNQIGGSGALYQDCTEVLLVIRDEDESDKFKLTYTTTGHILVMKTKSGKSGSVHIQFHDGGAKIVPKKEDLWKQPF